MIGSHFLLKSLMSICVCQKHKSSQKCDFGLSNWPRSNTSFEAKWMSWLNLMDTKPEVGYWCVPSWVPGDCLNAGRWGICQSNGSRQEKNFNTHRLLSLSCASRETLSWIKSLRSGKYTYSHAITLHTHGPWCNGCTCILFNDTFPHLSLDIPFHSVKLLKEKNVCERQSWKEHIQHMQRQLHTLLPNDLRIEVIAESSLFQWFHAVLHSIKSYNESVHNSNIDWTQELLNQWITWFCSWDRTQIWFFWWVWI